MLTNLKLFFWSADAKKNYGHKNIRFQDFVRFFKNGHL